MWSNSFADNTTGGFFNGPNPTDSPAPKEKEGRRAQSVMPVCIRQIHACTTEEFSLFGLKGQILQIIGILKEQDVQSLKAIYEIEDNTGAITAIWWLESDTGTSPNLPPVKVGCYVKVYGSFRIYENKKSLMIMRMFPVDDLNEITSHYLQVIHLRLHAESLTKGTNLSKIQQNNPGLELANSMMTMETEEEVKKNGLTPLQAKVYNIVHPVTNPSGIARSAVLQHFPKSQHPEINDSLEFLINEGHVYSTIDNDHFKATDSC